MHAITKSRWRRPSLKGNSFRTVLPGPDRRRLPKRYGYQVIFCTGEPGAPGCAAIWEVRGGRTPYQVALERTEEGRWRWHCTCADAIYRAENEGRVCKHVRGLRGLGRPHQEKGGSGEAAFPNAGGAAPCKAGAGSPVQPD